MVQRPLGIRGRLRPCLALRRGGLLLHSCTNTNPQTLPHHHACGSCDTPMAPWDPDLLAQLGAQRQAHTGPVSTRTKKVIRPLADGRHILGFDVNRNVLRCWLCGDENDQFRSTSISCWGSSGGWKKKAAVGGSQQGAWPPLPPPTYHQPRVGCLQPRERS